MVVPFQLSDGSLALVDDCDRHLVVEVKWSRSSRKGYAAGRVGGQRVYLHRYILQAPKGLQVDHINGDVLDNRRSNLRLCTAGQNQWNVPGRSASGRKGVTKARNQWRAEIMVNRVRWIRFFRTFEEAVAQREAWERELHGEFAWGGEAC